MSSNHSAPSLALLERRARRGDVYALGALAVLEYHRTKTAAGADVDALAAMTRAALAGDNRCSRLLAVFLANGWRGLEANPTAAAAMWRLHARNEGRRRARIEAAGRRGVPADVVPLRPSSDQ